MLTNNVVKIFHIFFSSVLSVLFFLACVNHLYAAPATQLPVFEVMNHSVGISAVKSFSGDDQIGKDGVMSKLGFDLSLLYQEHKDYLSRGGIKVLKRPFQSSLKLARIKNEKVIFDAVASGPVDELAKSLSKLGMDNITVYGRFISGAIPITSLEKVAGLNALNFARPAYAKAMTGSVNSQGDVAMQSEEARTSFSVNGAGVTIGTLSDSYDCLGGAASDVASNDLPQNIQVLEDETGCGSGSDEGRAMMQIIHDVAPGVKQAFHTAFNGTAAFASGIIDLASIAGSDIINDDVIYFAEPMFQDGVIAQAIDSVKATGVAYFSAAGNQADQSYESAFDSSGITGRLAGSVRHDFDTSSNVDSLLDVSIPGNTQVIFVLQWDDPFYSVSGTPGADTDMDMILYSSKGVAQVGGIDANIGGDAVEIFSFTTKGGPAKNYRLSIDHNAGPAPGRVKFVYFGDMTINEFSTDSATSYGHPIAAGGQAVGATRYSQTPAYGVVPPLIEYFSSKGGTPILFDTSGNPVNQLRQKPDIVAPDGGDTTFFGSDYEGNGYPNFFGTSAAAPHAAAMAALLKQFDNTLQPDDIYACMQNTAIDMGAGGFDFNSGHGLIQAMAALGSLDIDMDTVPNSIDNCPGIANANQENNDADEQGDICDTDDDNDSLLDVDEISWGTDPFNNDSDGDGLQDGEEVNIYLTVPTSPDTDADGLNDGDEITYGLDPLVSSKGHLAPRGALDNIVNVGDLVVLQRIIFNLVTPTELEIILADINSDGELNVADILLMHQLL